MITSFIKSILFALLLIFVQADSNKIYDFWMSFERASSLSSAEGKPILIFFEAEWCSTCKLMDKEIFSVTDISTEISDYAIPVKIDVDSKDVIVFRNKSITKHDFTDLMKIRTTPTVIFLDSEGNVLAHITGYTPPDRFLKALRFLHSEYFGEISFEEFYEINDN